MNKSYVNAEMISFCYVNLTRKKGGAKIAKKDKRGHENNGI